ncbi:MAG: Membrane protein-like protein [Verrucomicrobiales bacterium]|nr:Membrane protein-like protein [Verrucomicrobiales bacterium]
MNDQDRNELEQLKRRQELLQRQVTLLKDHIDRFDHRLTTEPVIVPEPPPIPPIIEPIRVERPALVLRQRPFEPAAQPTPVIQEPARASAEEFRAQPPIVPPAPVIAQKTSLELRLGTFWLVRIGIVVLLTGLAFLGYYAYDNIIGRLGAGGKLSLIYFAGGLLIGAGAWLQRKLEKPAMKNYGQVLFAGGLATVYFATYAAHYLPPLRVITSGLIDGILLLGWAAVIVWIADRRKSEVLALFAVSLAYYTAVVTDIGLFTLYSNIILTAAAVFFLLRNRWATISIVSLPATYGAFVFWRFYHHGDFLWDLRAEQLNYGNIFLAGYWIMFTAAAFLSRSEKLLGFRRASYLSINNGAFFGMVILSMLHVNHGNFWKFSLGFGMVLIALAAAARKLLANEPLCAKAYLTQGLVLVTVGFIAYFSGLSLALVLAAESVILLVLGGQQKSAIMHWGSALTALMSVPWLVLGMESHANTALGLGVGALLGFNMIWASRCERPTPGVARALTTFFTILALFAWAYLDWKSVPTEWFGSSLAIGAVILMAAFYALKIPEGVLLSQTYLIGSQVLWMYSATAHGRPAWWHPLILIAATVGASHWWEWQKRVTMQSGSRQTLQGLYALATIAVLYTWLQPHFELGAWLALTSALALALTIYALSTRAWLLAAAAQLFLVVSGIEFVREITMGKPDWYLALVPMIVLVAMVWIVGEFFISRLPDDAKRNVPQISLLYLAIAVLMSLWWVHEYIPVRERIWVLGLVGTVTFLAAGWKGSRKVAAFGGVYLGAALVTLVYRQLLPTPLIYFPDFAFILVLLGLQQVVARQPKRFPLQPEWSIAMIVAGMLSLWLYTSRWVIELSGGSFYLTAAWAVLALVTIALGFFLRERIYRWIGLAILACALARVVVDVWQLEIIYRILSLLALGVVLLALGFVYNKYQEKIREWL